MHITWPLLACGFILAAILVLGHMINESPTAKRVGISVLRIVKKVYESLGCVFECVSVR